MPAGPSTAGITFLIRPSPFRQNRSTMMQFLPRKNSADNTSWCGRSRSIVARRRGGMISVAIPTAARTPRGLEVLLRPAPQSPVSGIAAGWADFGRYTQLETLSCEHNARHLWPRSDEKLLARSSFILLIKLAFQGEPPKCPCAPPMSSCL